jgi:hypothetical protein
MKRRYTSRPAPAMSAFAALVGVGMLGFGIFAMSQAGEFHPFFLLWIAVGVGVVGYHLVNAVSSKGVATEIIEAEDMGDEQTPAKSVAERLRELDLLKQHQLVSASEYESKRQQILAEV